MSAWTERLMLEAMIETATELFGTEAGRAVERDYLDEVCVRYAAALNKAGKKVDFSPTV